MEWSLMSVEEIHAFGIEVILPYLKKEGVTITEVNSDPSMNPQIVGQRWDSPAFIYVRTALYPDKGALSEKEFMDGLAWADKHKATAFFASVGIACLNYPDKSEVKSDEHMKLPIRKAGFAVAYEGLVIMATSDRVRIVGEDDKNDK